MRSSLSLSAALLVFVAPAASAVPVTLAESPRSLVEQAAAAYGVYDINRAEALYRRASNDPQASPPDRGIARREWARIIWLVDGDAAAARKILEAGIAEDPDPCPAALLYARMLGGGGKSGSARIDALAVQCLAIEPGIAVERVRARMLEAAAAPSPDPLLREANGRWDALPLDAQSGPAGSRLLLALGLLSHDAERALAGWRSYFGLGAGEDAPQGLRSLAPDAAGTFERGLAPDAPSSDRLALAILLMRAGFAEELRRFAAGALEGIAADDAERRTIDAYLALRTAIDAEVLAHDRRYARHGAADEDAYEERLRRILAAAVASLGRAGKVDGAGEDPWPALRRHFNLFGTIGKSNGVSSLHLGHVVVDEQMSVTQDGRSGTLRFLAIDLMAQNGFSGWLADGAGGPGGWAVDGTTIIQVRPRFMATVETSLALARPGAARDRALREIETKRRSDRAIARNEPISYLPGVRDRLRLQGIDDIVASVRAAGISEAGFAPAFRKAYAEATFGSAIVAHEGRHALDQIEFPGGRALPNEELEYRAKLSEIAFSVSPRLALSSIYSPLFGGSTGHGIANRRLAAELARWIAANGDQVAGYDPQRTPLEQLDPLTNDQLRAIVPALDTAVRAGAPVS